MFIAKDQKIEPLAFRNAMSHFAEAVHILTTDGPAGRRGVTISAVCSVSDDPATMLVCLNRKHEFNHLFIENQVFALNTLSYRQQALSEAFSGKGDLSQADRFALGNWHTAQTGAPVLVDALASFDCRIIDTHEVATHYVIYGKVTAINMGDYENSLVYLNRGYHRVGE
ncbi:cob(II)yrinic acid a,c-diamide reductase [Phyllobacterium ifriqiyense]|uniref:Cob(II)yrinic acid a,c-diamide reductase n=2 Tax=Phyllobacteriaceae TaxID=69277 RepID=A0ABU0SF49_9HYPH|nr:cob(II)yrinic acid a,c-diamide reductase [Phyllobacterium ifriqiyense]